MKLFINVSQLVVIMAGINAMAGFPNDTGTKILSSGNGQPSDCQTVKPSYGYLSRMGDNGGAGKIIVLGIAVQNLNYTKQVFVSAGTSGSEPAVFTTRWYEYNPSIRYLDSNSGPDNFEIVDRRIGPENDITLNVTVVMNGSTYECSNIRIGK